MLRDLNKNQKFESDEIFTYTKDHLGSVRDITNNNAELVQRYDFTSYGITKLEKDPANPSYKFIENNYTYTAQDYDIETGLTRHGVRWYDAFSGRWLSPDPLGLVDDINDTRYVKSDPVNRIDQSGLDAKIISGGFHQFVIISNPNNPGNTFLAALNPEGGFYVGAVTVFPAITARGEVEIRPTTANLIDIFHNPSKYGYKEEFYRKQGPAADDAALIRASRIQEEFKIGKRFFDALGIEGGQNCIDFASEVVGR